MKPNQSLPGWFSGSCTNETCNLSANLLLHITRATEAKIYGELGLYGDLGGGGPFHGSVQGNTVRFSTCDPRLQCVVEWVGEWTGNGLAGNYEVRSDHPDLEAQGLDQQAGVWSCAFMSRPGSFAADRLKLVWVFHEGQAEGPFSTEAFVEHATKGRWPPHALAAREHYTMWQTVPDLLSSFQAATIAGN